MTSLGIAHADVGNVSEEVKEKYYAVNTDLTLEIAKKAKETAEKRSKDGVEKKTQFIFMSSAIIYGDSAPYGNEKMIDEDTIPQPANFYGDSKWQADKGVRALADEYMKVAVLRPPMIYGKDLKVIILHYQSLPRNFLYSRMSITSDRCSMSAIFVNFSAC